MPAFKPNHISPTAEEDAAITAAALSDPDALPLTDEDFGGFFPHRELYPPKPRPAWTDKPRRATAEVANH